MITMLKAALHGDAVNIVLESWLMVQDFYREFGFVDTGPVQHRTTGEHLVSYIPVKYSMKTSSTPKV